MPAGEQELDAHRFFLHAADNFDIGRGGYRGKRLTAKAEGAKPRNIVGSEDLAGSVTFERKLKVLRGNAAAVVDDPDEIDPTALDLHVDPGGTGVDGIVEKLSHDRVGPLDNLSRGDPGRDVRRENMDRPRRSLSHGQSAGAIARNS